MSTSNDLTRQGIAALKAGDTGAAARLLYQATEIEPNNQAAWLWLSGCVESDDDKRTCLERALAIDATSEAGRRAAKGLESLRRDALPLPPNSPMDNPSQILQTNTTNSPSSVPQERTTVNPSRPEFITLSCPSCGGQLKVTSDLERFACAYCGTEHIVRRGEGTVSLQPMVEGLRHIQFGTDRTASELAIQRLTPEIDRIKEKLHKLITIHKGFSTLEELERKARQSIVMERDGKIKQKKLRAEGRLLLFLGLALLFCAILCVVWVVFFGGDYDFLLLVIFLIPGAIFLLFQSADALYTCSGSPAIGKLLRALQVVLVIPTPRLLTPVVETDFQYIRDAVAKDKILYAQREQEIQDVQKELEAKKNELRKHEQIVRMD